MGKFSVFNNPQSVSRRKLSLEKDKVRISAWPSSVCSKEPLAVYRSLTVRSQVADATNWPSGEKATAVTESERHVSISSEEPGGVPEPDRLVIGQPSSEKVTAITQFEWPSSVFSEEP